MTTATWLTWKGEDTKDYAGPSFTTWYGKRFPKDVPVEASDPEMIRRAKGNRFFEVHESAGVLDSVVATAPASPPVVKRGPGRPPKVREPIPGEY